MATLVKDRKKSSAQYVYNGVLIYKHIRKYYKKLKVFGAEYRTQILESSSRILYFVNKANSIPLNSSRYKDRISALEEAKYSLIYLENIISIFETDEYDELTAYFWNHLGELMEEEQRLLKGCIDMIDSKFNK